VGFVFIALTTLAPLPAKQGASPLLCLTCGRMIGADAIRNILLFAPFAMGLRLAGWPSWRVLLAAFAITLTVELLQYRVVTGRESSLVDVVMNTLGGAVGVLLADHLAVVITPRQLAARRLAAGGSVLWLFLLVGTGLALDVRLPASPYRWVRSGPGPDLDWFRGSVLSASVLRTIPLAPGWIPESATLRERIRSEGTRIDAVVTAGRATLESSTIVGVATEDTVTIAMLQEDDDALTLDIGLRAAAAGLRTPSLRLRHVFPAAGSPDTVDTLRLSGALVGHRLSLAAESRRARHFTGLTLSPSLGWMFVLPFRNAAEPWSRVLTALWIGGLLFPLSYWSARGRGAAGRDRTMFEMLVPVTAGVGLFVVPLTQGFPVPHWSEWLAAAAGVAAGRAIAGLASRTEAAFGWHR
jgi:hypothetical protein